jgi:tetratricopeptide (TPR) repeat protein
MRGSYAVVLALAFAAAPAAAASLEGTQANIHFNLALKQYQAQKLDEANATVKKALSLVPGHPQANLLSGLIACQQSRFKDAIDPLNVAAKALPQNVDAPVNLGVAYFQLGKLDEAEAAWKKALALQPSRNDVAMNLGTLYLRRKDYASAQKTFAQVTQGEPANARAWSYLAEASEAGGDKDAANSARLKALELQPDDQALRVQTGERLYQANRVSEAAQVLAPLQGKGEATAEFLLGVLAYRQGRFEESRERFETALKDRPDYPEARFNLAITFYDQGRYPEALDQFKAVLAQHPDDDEARKNLDVTRQAAVRASLKDGSQDFLKADYAAALSRWKSALELEPDNKVVKDLVETASAQLKLQADELISTGKAAWDAGKKEEAILAYAQALEHDPSNAAAKAGLDGAKSEAARLVKAYAKEAEDDLKDGRLSQARANADKVSALDATAGKALAAKIDQEADARFSKAKEAAAAAAKKGALADEIDAWQRAVEAKPESAEAQEKLNLAKVDLRQALNSAEEAAKTADKAGKKAEAIKQYQRVLELQPGHAAARDALKRLRPAQAKAVDSSQADEIYYQGVYAYAGGDVDKAVALWKKVLASNPQHRLAKEALDRAQRRKNG